MDPTKEHPRSFQDLNFNLYSTTRASRIQTRADSESLLTLLKERKENLKKKAAIGIDSCLFTQKVQPPLLGFIM
jgi:hypothetical protein